MRISTFASRIAPNFEILRTTGGINVTFSYALSGIAPYSGDATVTIGTDSFSDVEGSNRNLSVGLFAQMASGILETGSWVLRDYRDGTNLSFDFNVALFNGNATYAGMSISDIVFGSIGGDTLNGGGGHDFLSGGGGGDTMNGGAGDDTFYANADDILVEAAGGGFDRAIYGVGAAFALASGVSIEWMELENPVGTASINLTGNEFSQTISGNDGSNTINGGAGSDTLYGYAGDDFLNGGGGGDYMRGGTGNDTYYAHWNDTPLEAAGQGYDRIYYYSGTDFILADDVEIEWVALANVAGTAAVNLTGNTFGQAIYGNNGENIIKGGGGADSLYGNGGNDLLNGGGGGDTMDGGAGDDRYYANADDIIVDSSSTGEDRVFYYAGTSFALQSQARIEWMQLANDTATTAVNLTGNDYAQVISGNNGVNVMIGNAGADSLYGYGDDDRLYGGGGADRLKGGAGNDILDGGTNNDRMTGGIGNDTYYVNDGDTIEESPDEGTDSVIMNLGSQFTLATGVSIEFISIHSNINGGTITGNEFAQVLTGNARGNNLTGMGGDDTLFGLDGNDNLFGGAGGDTMHGGVGGDEYFAVDANDTIIDGDGGESASIYDRVFFAGAGDFVLGAEANVERAYVEAGTTAANLTSNSFGMNLYGNDGVNVLTSGSGVDQLFGYAGSDVLIGSVADTMNGGDGDDEFRIIGNETGLTKTKGGLGIDTVMFLGTPTVATLGGSGIEIMKLDPTGTANINMQGTDNAETIIGNNGSNRIGGYAGNDTLTGLGGADMFDFKFHFDDESWRYGRGIDEITDFTSGVDTIELRVTQGAGMVALPSANFAANATGTNTVAPGETSVVYNTTTGELTLNIRVGEGDTFMFGKLTGVPTITASDFAVHAYWLS